MPKKYIDSRGWKYQVMPGLGENTLMKTQLGYDAIEIDGMIKALREAEEVTAAQQPNDPLTLEELREMDGEPVWIIPMRGSGGFRTWMLVDAEYELCREAHGEMAVFENCGKTWLAYRRRPEEVGTCQKTSSLSG